MYLCICMCVCIYIYIYIVSRVLWKLKGDSTTRTGHSSRVHSNMSILIIDTRLVATKCSLLAEVWTQTSV